MVSGYVIKIVRCHNLPAKNVDGFSDAYVKLKLDGHGKQKTKVVKRNLNPEWNQEFRYSNWGTSEKLLVQVWDYTGPITKRLFIGQVTFTHPNQGNIGGEFPLVDQTGEPVGGTLELSITCEGVWNSNNSVSAFPKYLVGVERRVSLDAIEQKNAFTPTAVNPQVFQETEREKERENELVKAQKELEEAQEKEKLREKEREEDRQQLEEALKKVADLEEEKKKTNTTIEMLEMQLAEARQSLSGSQTNDSNRNVTCWEWLANLFSCCMKSSKKKRTT